MTNPNIPPHDPNPEDTSPAKAQDTRAYNPQDDTAENVTNRTKAINIQEQQPEPVDIRRQGGGVHVEKQQPKPTPTINPQQPQQRLRYPPRDRKPRTKEQESGLYLPWWSLVLMLIVVLGVAFGLVFFVYLLGNPTGTVDDATPIIRVITAQPTVPPTQALPTAQAPATLVIAGGNAPSSLSLEGPTLEAVQFTPTPLAIKVGETVQVDGVDDQQLNVRDTYSIGGSSVLFRADEGTLFTIVAGPQQADGFTWWQIQDPTNPNRIGWAVANFLQVVVQN